MRSHRPKSVDGWESADRCQDNIQGCVSRLQRQAPTQIHVDSVIPLYSMNNKGSSRHRNGAVRAGSNRYQQLNRVIPPFDHGAQHHRHRCIATHPAGYVRAKTWNDYFSAYQTASAECDHCIFGWDLKLVCSMTMLG